MSAPSHEPLPELYTPLLARFRLTARERLIGRLLLLAVRLPGSPSLLRAWHAHRSRRRA